jgi:hypothetical protein
MNILRCASEMKLFLRIVRWMRLGWPRCVPWYIVWVCGATRTSYVVSRVVTDGKGCSGGSLGECLRSLLQVGVLGWGVLHQEASLELFVWWTHVLFVGFNVGGVTHLIGRLPTSWLVNRWCALTIRSPASVLDTPYRLIIPASILWMQHFRLLLLEMSVSIRLLLINPSVILSKHPLQLCSSLLSLDQSAIKRAVFVCRTDSLSPGLFWSSRFVMMVVISLLMMMVILYVLLWIIFLVVLTPPLWVDQGIQRTGAGLVRL